MISQVPTHELLRGAKSGPKHDDARLAGLRAGMVVFSSYPADPRPRRAIDALLSEGMSIDLICQAEAPLPRRQTLGQLTITRVPIRNARGGALSYVYQYCAFIFVSAILFAWRSLRHRYDLIYVHNMPDVLVVAALVPKILGAKVILDQHDPMPELLMTIFEHSEQSTGVRLLRRLERWSFLCADKVITVNEACRKIFAARSCRAEKVGVIMNCPDEALFPYHASDSWPPMSQGKAFVMMYHGSLVERNGLGLAVEALAILVKSVPNVELRVYGSRTPYLDRVLERAQVLGLERCVRYLGPKKLDDLAKVIGECDLGVIPNRLNTFTELNTPTRIFEYLALGKAVVVPGTQGILDYFDGNSLFFFEAGNASDLARAMEEAVTRPERAREIARRGQQVYLRHTWSSEREALIGFVAELVGRSPADARVAAAHPGLAGSTSSEEGVGQL